MVRQLRTIGPRGESMSNKHSDAYEPPHTTTGGYNGYQVVSAMQKCIRRALERDALFWATELWASCDAKGREYIWHRLRVIASEDVGLADNNACVQVSALYANFQRRPNEKLFLWHAVLLLARAPKSRIVDHARYRRCERGPYWSADTSLRHRQSRWREEELEREF